MEQLIAVKQLADPLNLAFSGSAPFSMTSSPSDCPSFVDSSSVGFDARHIAARRTHFVPSAVSVARNVAEHRVRGPACEPCVDGCNLRTVKPSLLHCMIRDHFHFPRASVSGAAALCFSACASLPSSEGVDGVNRAVAARSDVRATWLGGRAADSVAMAYAAQALHGVVPVDTAIRVALLRNKRLQATFEDLGIAQADVVQAGLLANPVFSGSRFHADGGGPGILQLGLALPFIDYLQRPARRGAARRAYAAEQSRVAAAVISLVADVRVAYAEAQASEQMEELRATVLQAPEAGAIAAGALHDAGNVSDFDLAQQQAMAADARLALLTARGERRAYSAALARVMGVTSDTSWRPSPRLGMPTDTLPPVQVLAPLAQARNLELRAAFESAAAAGRLAGLAKTFALLPDGSIGVGRETDPDGRFTGATLTVWH
jgi:outer membrane protein, heavy metal efflux system